MSTMNVINSDQNWLLVMRQWEMLALSSAASGECAMMARLCCCLFMLGWQQGPPSADMGTMTKLLSLTSATNPYTMWQVFREP